MVKLRDAPGIAIFFSRAARLMNIQISDTMPKQSISVESQDGRGRHQRGCKECNVPGDDKYAQFIDVAVGIDKTFQNAMSSSFDRIQLKKDDRDQVVAMISNIRDVMVHENFSVIHWRWCSALPFTSQGVPGQWRSIYSEAAMVGNKFREPMSMRSSIQSYYLLMWDISDRPYCFPAITVADKLYGLFPLSEYLFAQMAYGARSVSNCEILSDNWEIQG
jgi:hypothetical protein